MVHLFPSCWSGAEIKCTVHACCSAQITHKLGDQQSRQQALRDYCPNIYTVFKGDSLMSENTWDEMHSEPTTAEIMKLPGESKLKRNIT